MTTQTAPIDEQQVEAFAGQVFDMLSSASVALMTSVGHRVGLFDTMAGQPPATSREVADAAGLRERYVREWLGAMTTGGVVRHDPDAGTFHLPAEHAAVLTRAAGPDNLANLMQFVPLLAQVEDPIVDCFREGGGVPYAAYERFHAVMAEQSAATNDAALVDTILPLVPELPDRLRRGIRVADIGCGQGHAINLMGAAFPASEFVGYDFEPEAVDVARSEAAGMGLENVHFEVRDVADLDGTGQFDLVTAFDAVHDQARPGRVLAEVADVLTPDGVLLMVDIRASSDLQDNVEIPWAPFLYTVSTMHCMTVSLSLDGAGLGTVWGEQIARRMLAEAGFTDVQVREVEGDPINAYFVARR